MIKISVVIPLYGAEQYIERCINSLLKQTLIEFEVLCVNDCGPDKSLLIIKSLIEKDSRIKVFENEKNMGPMYSRMIGYKEAKGEYIAFLDSDDMLPKDALNRLYLKAKEKNADIVSGDLKYVWNDGREKLISSSLKYGTDKISVFKSLLSIEYQHILCNKIFRRELIQSYSYEIFPNMKRGEDSCMFYQLVNNAKVIIHINEIIYFYMDNETSSSHYRLNNEDIKSIVTTNYIIWKICKQYPELENVLYQRISRSLCALYTQGYGKDPILGSTIKKYELNSFVSINEMRKHFDVITFVKILIKRYMYPIIGKTQNE